MTATLEALIPSRDGTEVTYTAPLSDDDTFENTGHEVVLIRLSEGITLTINIPFTVDSAAGSGLAVTPRTLSMGVGDHLIGPFPPNIYNDSDGLVALNYGGDSASVEIAILRMP